jgi:hypothetical protein
VWKVCTMFMLCSLSATMAVLCATVPVWCVLGELCSIFLDESFLGE